MRKCRFHKQAEGPVDYVPAIGAVRTPEQARKPKTSVSTSPEESQEAWPLDYGRVIGDTPTSTQSAWAQAQQQFMKDLAADPSKPLTSNEVETLRALRSYRVKQEQAQEEASANKKENTSWQGSHGLNPKPPKNRGADAQRHFMKAVAAGPADRALSPYNVATARLLHNQRLRQDAEQTQLSPDMQKKSSQQGVCRMNPKLQAGIELTIEKTAAQEMGVGLLSSTLNRKLHKLAAENQGVQVTRADGAGSPSSDDSCGMEDKNEGFGKGKEKLDDDPTKKNAQQTGATQNVFAGANFTTEKKASALAARTRVLTTMLRSVTR